VCVYLQVRLARKEWVKEQAAAHLARSTAAHTSTILLGWREIAAVQRCQRYAKATASALHCCAACLQVLRCCVQQTHIRACSVWFLSAAIGIGCSVSIASAVQMCHPLDTLHQSSDLSWCIPWDKTDKSCILNRPYVDQSCRRC